MPKPSLKAGRRPMRVIDGTIMVKEGAGGPGKIRCPMTHQLATPTVRPDGSRIYTTPGGRTYKITKL